MRITGEMGNLAAWEKRLFYMCSARPTLHPRALFSDVTSDYRSPAEPVPGDEVTIRLRTGRYNVDKAYLVVDNVEHVMTRVRSESMFDYYEAKINVGTDKIYYYFKVELGRTVCYYNQIGAIKDLNPYYNFQITPGFKTPEWAKGAVMYQIFVDRFYNGDKSNNSGNDDSGNNSQNTRPAGKVISCTIEIRCDNATARKDTVNPSIASRIPDDGTILEVTTYTAVEGFTVYDVLAAVTAMHDPVIPIVANSDKSYVSSINNLSEKNVGPQSGWTYRVNGVLPMMAANQYTVKDGDVIKWIYVCQLGDK